MKYVAIVLAFCGGLGVSGNWAMAADRPGALGAMGLGGTLVGSSALPRSRSMVRASANRSAAGDNTYAQYLENRRRKAEHYFEMRRMNDSYRAERRSPSLTPEQLADINESRLPPRLTPEKWQPALGVAVWPAPLRGSEHAAERARLEILFAERTPEDSGVGSAAYAEVRRLTRRMRELLAAQAKEMSVEEYAVARKFIESLAYEARFAPTATN